MNPRPRHPRLVGLAAFVALAFLLVGLPAVLLALGWGPMPSSLDGWWSALTTPDDGHLTVLLMKAMAWVVWVLLAVTILIEGVAAPRGRHAPTLPGLRWTQVPARRLVAAALLLFISVPATGVQAATAAPEGPVPMSPTVSVAPHTPASDQAASTPSPSRDAATTVIHTVKRGETLWSIAEERLGSGSRYPDIVKLNRELLNGKPGFLKPGWVLRLPAEALQRSDAAAAASAHSSYTVVKGDTLSEIAEDRLGDADAWPRIYQDSRDITQPDGRRLTDPDLIIPGWHLQIPTVEPVSGPQPSAESGDTSATLDADEAVPGTDNPAPSTVPTPVSQPAVTEEPAVSIPAGTEPAKTPPAAAPTGSNDTTQQTTQVESARDNTPPAPWLLVGLTGGGAVLAAGLLAGLQQRRRAQFRARRPGRTIAVPPPELIPVEKTLLTEGPAATPTLVAIDEALKLLGACGADRGAVPALQAVQVLPGEVAVRLAQPASLSEPWRSDSEDGRRWALASGHGAPIPTGRAPYPQLVSVGQDDGGATWLVNLEHFGTVSLTGDPTYAADFARYVAAEIAVNPWSRHVQLVRRDRTGSRQAGSGSGPPPPHRRTGCSRRRPRLRCCHGREVRRPRRHRRRGQDGRPRR